MLRYGIHTFILSLIAFFMLIKVFSQDLEPRLSAVGPTKLNFVIVSYMYSTGNILTDVALPIKDLNASIHTGVIGYVRTFKLFGVLNKFDVEAPYSFASWDLYVQEDDTTTQRSGFGDPMFRWGIIFFGGPALTPSEFAKAELKKFRMGFGIRIRAPLGQYDPEKVFNIGMNRWAFKLALTAGFQAKKMLFETKLAIWVFTANTNFYGGNTLHQNPMACIQFHWSYVFKPGLWIAASFDIYGYGKISLNNAEYKNVIENTRVGLALAIPLAKGHTIKLTYNAGASARFGVNFNTLAIVYQFMWVQKH